ncbi:LCP family protein [Kitasatospora sp. NPDC059571]|uniref:LCP family protein n=1 Tax=Kitasatospora sp. NPDC059571 TaxID=3346871 RepID=UPI00369CBA60
MADRTAGPTRPERGAHGPAGGPSERPRRRRRTTAAWLAVGALTLCTLGGCLLYEELNGGIATFSGDGISRDRPAAAAPDAAGRTPVNLLLIGSDSRDGANHDLGGGDEGAARSDTTILLHVFADHRRAVGVSIPRDALVDIPSCRLPDGGWTEPAADAMFNSAFSVGDSGQGNPACTQNTVERLTGLRIDHTAVVDFRGFAALADAVGGVEVCLPRAVREGDLDPNLGYAGREIFAQGRQKVGGQAALDYVRIRHGLGDGSDIGRTKRQQAFLASLLKQVKAKGMDPTTLLPLAEAASRALTVDPGLGSVPKLVSFAASLKDIPLHEVTFLTAPWRYDGFRVRLLRPDADRVWQALAADRPLDGPVGASAAPSAPAPSAAVPEPGGSAAPRASFAGGGETAPAPPAAAPTGPGRSPRPGDADVCSDLTYG